jgi:hypothetical protein
MSQAATAAVRLLTGEREPVRLATTDPIDVDLGGLVIVDGVQTEVGDRILVTGQTDGSENGIRTASEGQWYRAADARSARTMQRGTTVTVQEGTYALRTFVFNTLDPVIGDDALSITVLPVSLTEAEIGVTVQAYSTNLDDWSGEAVADYSTTAEIAVELAGKQDQSANLDDWSALATSAKQDASVNLTTLAAVTPGATGLALLATTTVPLADAVFSSGRLGSTASLVADLNGVAATGWYRTDGATTNGPLTALAFIQHQQYTAGAAIQTWYALGTAGTWLRRQSGAVWGAWARAPEKLSDQVTWTAAQAVTPAALTDGASITPNLTLSNIFTVTLGGNRTLANPSSKVVGQGVTFIIRQDGTGSRTLAYGTQYKWPGGVAPTLSTAINSIDVISGLVVSSTEIVCNITQAFA